jgi:2,3-bisphosphoglycerate-dependent phosphoglycerate mutase
MQATTVLLVRHAAPVLPAVGDLPEVDNERGLTDDGRRAASRLASRLETLPITAIYSSPYRRAVETVEPLATRLGLGIRLHDDLAERWLAARILGDDEWLGVYRRTWEDVNFCPAGGESRSTTQKRALSVLSDIRQQHGGEIVVVSTHGGLIGCLLRSMNEHLPLDDVLRMPMPAVFTLKERGDGWRLSAPSDNLTSIVMRLAGAEDVPAIADVSVRSRLVARRGVYSQAYLDALTIQDAESATLASIGRQGWRTWVAELGGTILAYATAGPWADDPRGRTADIDDLYVDPGHFRRGIGSELLDHVEAELALDGYQQTVLWVREGDGALEAFYSAQGYRQNDRTKQLVKDRPRSFRLWTKLVADR